MNTYFFTLISRSREHICDIACWSSTYYISKLGDLMDVIYHNIAMPRFENPDRIEPRIGRYCPYNEHVVHRSIEMSRIENPNIIPRIGRYCLYDDHAIQQTIAMS